MWGLGWLRPGVVGLTHDGIHVCPPGRLPAILAASQARLDPAVRLDDIHPPNVNCGPRIWAVLRHDLEHVVARQDIVDVSQPCCRAIRTIGHAFSGYRIGRRCGPSSTNWAAPTVSET